MSDLMRGLCPSASTWFGGVIAWVHDLDWYRTNIQNRQFITAAPIKSEPSLQK
jgi:hypothetical protein